MAISDFVLNLYNQTPRGRANALKPGDIVRVLGGTGITGNSAVQKRQRAFWLESIGEVISEQDWNGIVTVKVRNKTHDFHYAYLEKLGPCRHEN